MSLADLPLRARKQAQTRHALVSALIARLGAGDRTLEDIAVVELCAAAGISEASFFNYFPKKSDLLVHYVRVWSLDLAWHIAQLPEPTSARAAIELIFESTGRAVSEHPGVMIEILAHQARWSGPPAGELTLADRVVAFPERAGIEDLPAVGLEGLIPALLERAIAQRELPSSTDVQSAFLGIVAIFFGVPAVLARRQPALIGPAYKQQLAVVWTGLVHSAPSPRNRRRS